MPESVINPQDSSLVVDQIFSFPYNGKEYMTTTSGKEELQNGNTMWNVEGPEGNRELIDASFVEPHIPKDESDLDGSIYATTDEQDSLVTSTVIGDQPGLATTTVDSSGTEIDEQKYKEILLESRDAEGNVYYPTARYPMDKWDAIKDDQEQVNLLHQMIDSKYRETYPDRIGKLSGTRPDAVTLIDLEKMKGASTTNFWDDSDVFDYEQRKSTLDANQKLLAEKDWKLTELFGKSMVEGFVPLGTIYDLPQPDDLETGEKVALYGGYGVGTLLSFALESMFTRGTSVIDDAPRVKKFRELAMGLRKAETKRIGSYGTGPLPGKHFAKPNKEYWDKLNEFNTFLNKSLKATKGKPLIETGGFFGSWGKYSDFIMDIGAGQYGIKLGKLNYKTGPKIANSFNRFVENMLLFNMHGAIHDKGDWGREGVKRRIEAIPDHSLDAVKFSFVQMPRIAGISGMAGTAWKWAGEPTAMFGIGYGWAKPGEGKYPDGKQIPEEDRIIQGLMMTGFHYSMMGMNRLQTKHRMRQALVSSGIYTEKDARKFMASNTVEKILNIARQKAALDNSDQQRFWVNPKGRKIQVLHVESPIKKGDKWHMAWRYEDASPETKPTVVTSATKQGLFNNFNQRHFKPLKISADLRYTPPTGEPSQKQHDRKVYLKQNKTNLDKVVKGEEAFGMEGRNYKVEGVENESGNVTSYKVKLKYLKDDGKAGSFYLWSPSKNSPRTFRHESQAKKFVEDNWMEPGAASQHLQIVNTEANKINTNKEYKDWGKAKNITKQTAVDAGFTKTNMEFFVKKLYPGSGGRLESLNQGELNTMETVFGGRQFMSPKVLDPPLSWWGGLTKDLRFQMPDWSQKLLLPAYSRLMMVNDPTSIALGRKSLMFELHRQQLASGGIELTNRLLDKGVGGLTESELVNISSLLDPKKFGDFLNKGEYEGKRDLINILHRRFMDNIFTHYLASDVQQKTQKKSYIPMFEIFDKRGRSLGLELKDDGVRLLTGYKYDVIDVAIDPKTNLPKYVYKILGEKFFDTQGEAYKWAKDNGVSTSFIKATRSHQDLESGETKNGYLFKGQLRYVYNIKNPPKRHSGLTPTEYAQYRAENPKLNPDRILKPHEADVVKPDGSIGENATVYTGGRNSKNEAVKGAKGTYVSDYLFRMLSKEAKESIVTSVRDNKMESLVEALIEADPYLSKLSTTNMKGLSLQARNDIKNSSTKEIAQQKLEQYRRLKAKGMLEMMSDVAGEKTVFGQPHTRVADLPPTMAFDADGVRIPLGKGSYNVKKGDKIKVSSDPKTGVKTGAKDPSGKHVIDKVMNVYERDYTKLIRRYSEQAAHIISSYRHFGKDGAKNYEFLGMINDLKKTMGDEYGNWARNVIDKQINGWKTVNNPMLRSFGLGLTRATTNLGLSGPRSGLIKNLGLGQTENWVTFGTKLYVQGLKEWARNPEAFHNLNIKMGGAYAGYYDFAMKGGIFQYIGRTGFMKETEAWNRISSVAMGTVAAKSDFDILMGKYGTKKNRMLSLNRMKEVAKFDDADIQKMLKRGFMTEAEESQYIQMSHLITQGSPSLPFTPVWMSHPAAKPLSVFYRIGYRMTENLWRNTMKPLVQQDNPMPLLRHTTARLGVGSAMYWTAKTMFNEDNRNSFKKWVPQVWETLLQAEFLAMFSNILDDNKDPAYDIATWRLLENASSVVWHGLTGKQDKFNIADPFGGRRMAQVFQDLAKDNWVAYSDFDKALDAFTGDINTDLRWINKRRRNYMSVMHPDKKGAKLDEWDTEGIKPESRSYMDMLRKSFLAGDQIPEEELAGLYYAAVFTKMEEEFDKIVGSKGMGIDINDYDVYGARITAHKRAIDEVDASIKRTRPIPKSWEKPVTGARSEKDLFLSYLNKPGEKERYQKLETRWKGLDAKLKNVLRNKNWDNINPQYSFEPLKEALLKDPTMRASRIKQTTQLQKKEPTFIGP